AVRFVQVVAAYLVQFGRAIRFCPGSTRRRYADHAVGVEVLLETALKCFKDGTASCDDSGRGGDIVAVAVGVPDRVLIRTDHLPQIGRASCRERVSIWGLGGCLNRSRKTW